MQKEKAMSLIDDELARARQKFHNFNSFHEGFAVLAEEADELWEAVKRKNVSVEYVKKEAVQVAAMAVRFLTDLF